MRDPLAYGITRFSSTIHNTLGRMMRYRISVFMLAIAFLSSPTVWAQLSNVEANALGLETAWTAQARVPAYGRGIVSADLWVDEAATKKYAVAELPNRSLVKVSANKLDSKNQPIGMEKAKAETQAIAAKLLGQSTGFEVAEVTIPAIRLVIVTANGLVQNFDAESGKLLWATPCGPLDTNALPAALSSAGVLVVQGDTLYLLDWLTGKLLSVQRLPNSTSSAVTVIEGKIAPPAGVQRDPRINVMAMVGDFSGNLKAFGITEKITPWSSRTLGRSNSKPAISQDREMVAISTTAGMVYIFDGSTRPNVQFRYEARGGLTDSLAVGKDAFYVGGNDGSLAKISFQGRIEWTFHLSHPVTSPAIVDQENGLVFVSSEAGELTAVDESTGYEAWDSSVKASIRGPIALSGLNVICRTTDDRLTAYDKKTGQLLSDESSGLRRSGSTSNQSMLPAMLINTMTDRVYMASSGGRLQCLRPIGREIPKIFKPITVSGVKATESAPVNELAPAMEPADVGADPFGAANTDAPTDPSADPFGSGDPFGKEP
jgi:outer membrane protein assembly factor BamB